MHITLTPQLEALVRQKIETGQYDDASEVVRDALQLMAERDRREELRASLVVAGEQIERGEGVVWEPALMERLTREAIANSRWGKPIKDDVKP